ncbi:MAG: DMT family transporter [Terracidiphilus sp.]|nr:DMT family transporter [Terracidiphilus sp.]
MSAATWGGSDFVGGIGARRAPAMLVVASGHIFSLLVLLALCQGMRLALPGSHYLLYAALGGFEGSLGLAVFYRALAMGAMGLTAALTGLLTALVPVLFSLVHDGLPTPLTAAGLALGLIAIWFITCTPANKAAATPPMALLLGALAGIGFGSQLVLFKFASVGGVLWTMTFARAAGALAMILLLLVMPPKAPWRGFWFTGILAGSLDTVGSLFYLRATQVGRLDVAAVVCSLYPAGTILLAAFVLRERPTRRQVAGMVLALSAVMLLSI